MPVVYRDYVTGIQATNHESYRNQRSDPKVIIPDTGHIDNQAPIRLMNAPMAHPSVIAMFHDAQYETFFESKKALEKGFALRARITENADTKGSPKVKHLGASQDLYQSIRVHYCRPKRKMNLQKVLTHRVCHLTSVLYTQQVNNKIPHQ
jgi:hypothetical protein